MTIEVFGYSRVSGNTQKENTSFESQEDAIRRYCELSNHKLIEFRREVHTARGGSNRRVFQQTLTDLKRDKAGGLVVCRLDRFARSTLEGLQVVADLKAFRKELLIVELGFDTSTPIGNCILSVLLSFAELERTMIYNRTREGVKRAKDNGSHAAGAPPYGWTVTGETGFKGLTPVPHEQHIVRLILQYRASGKSFREIADLLNSLSIPSKQGKMWHHTAVVRVCKEQPIGVDRLGLGVAPH